MKNHFTIVIPSFNNERWVKKNLTSALKQEYENFCVSYTDDASTDKTYELAEEIIGNSNVDACLIRNETNKRALHNIVKSVEKSKPDSIILTLDGDDWLPHPQVLSTLNEIYSNPDVWITSGSYIDNSNGLVSSPVIKEGFWENNIRHLIWTISHLRTFRRELFLSINQEDLKDKDNEFYKFTFDQAMMFPMVEMSGPKHFHAIDEVLYVYNRNNPNSVDRIHRHEQLRIEQDIRRKKPYLRKENL